jgi:hypothetical protein
VERESTFVKVKRFSGGKGGSIGICNIGNKQLAKFLLLTKPPIGGALPNLSASAKKQIPNVVAEMFGSMLKFGQRSVSGA